MLPAGDVERGDEAARAPAGSRTLFVALGVVLGACLFLAVLAGAGSATVPAGNYNTTNDTTAPTVGELEKVDATTVELTIVDDTDVDEDSIDGADMFLDDGQIANVTATENGSNATVTVDLEAKVDTDLLRLAVADGASIYDEAGNELNASGDVWRSVSGMDGVAPTVRIFEVDDSAGDKIDLKVRTTEDLGGLWVRVYGPTDRFLNLSDFSKPSGIPDYVTSYQPSVSGDYRVTLLNVTDTHNNTWESGRDEMVTVDVVPPTAAAGIDFGASEDRTITFDANQSTDDVAIANVTWDFGDGSNATGWQPTHTFEPGNYSVELRVTDAVGNVGTDTLELNLTDGISTSSIRGGGAEDVRISAPTATESPSAIVSVPDAQVGQAVEISRQSGPLAATNAVSLDSLDVTLARNASLGLGIEATGTAPVSDVESVAGGAPIGGLTLVHDLPDANITSATFSVGVNESHLNSTGVDPQAVSLWRYNDGSWTELSTASLNASNGSHRYRATAPGLSRFAIAPSVETTPDQQSTPTPTPAPTPDKPRSAEVSSASLNRTSAAVGDPVAVNATVENPTQETVRYTAALQRNGSVLQTDSVSVPAGASVSVAFTHEATNGSYTLAVNDTVAGELRVEGSGDDTAGLLGFLGFLPLDLLGAILTYVGGGLAALFLVLKATALYLGY